MRAGNLNDVMFTRAAKAATLLMMVSNGNTTNNRHVHNKLMIVLGGADVAMVKH